MSQRTQLPLLVFFPSLYCHHPLVPLPLPISVQVHLLHTNVSRLGEPCRCFAS